jgi:cell division protein FtsB
MLKMESEMPSVGSSKRAKITLRAVCRIAGVTEQTLHKKEHSSLNQEVREWIGKLSTETLKHTSHLKNNGAKKLKDANKQLSTLAAELLVLRKQVIGLEAENRKLRQEVK